MLIKAQQFKWSIRLFRRKNKETNKETLFAQLTPFDGSEMFEIQTGDIVEIERIYNIPFWTLIKAWLTDRTLESDNKQTNLCKKR